MVLVIRKLAHQGICGHSFPLFVWGKGRNEKRRMEGLEQPACPVEMAKIKFVGGLPRLGVWCGRKELEGKKVSEGVQQQH